MDKKLRQVTDSIHGTIYLSSLESELISTPYFYRLHDIYQSSTVYMTYPSNRTKRYEHSLGTMELASTMLYTSVLNASPETKIKLFEKLEAYFSQIFDSVFHHFGNISAPYYIVNKEILEKFLDNYCKNVTEESVNINITNAINNGCFDDSALDYFQYYPMQNDIEYNQNNKNFFLYRCLLQSVRIIALFHDVGHPPYSHIIEDVLNDIYKEHSSSRKNNKNVKKLKECFWNYSKNVNVNTIISKNSLPKDMRAALHERVGLSFLESAINDTVPVLMRNILDSNLPIDCKIASFIYNTLVVEFSISMLVEKDIFFKSFHKIVDGVLDADRLDYITRDSLNSGVDWGKIPYKRLINSAKLVYLCNDGEENIPIRKRPFVISFPQKEIDDIEDLLLTRYKIFARINFHHRCMKTASALKASVKMLAEDYLSSSKDEDCINPNINLLWTSLGTDAGDRKKRVILWNDSWLISTLHQSLINLSGKENQEALALKENLEEILLNKKRHYSLLKRKVDNQKFIKKIINYIKLNEDNLSKLIEREKQKSNSNFDNNDDLKLEDYLSLPQFDALDSLNRIDELIADGDLECLNSIITTENCDIEKIVEINLQQLKDQDILLDFSIITNKDKYKDGLPKHKDKLDEIYLYDGGETFVFNEISLKQQIDAIRKNVPWLYIYIVPKHIENNKDLIEDVLDTLAIKIAESVRGRLEELFPNSQICT
ncbi:deoxyguanosinetriphosphate triphosphohydrolase-like protein [Lachnospiraceae bacterium]|nr:deoxyguanosinetriphosphate triphosphohydrolase-like protein [Lachnospiraceae bacterium]